MEQPRYRSGVHIEVNCSSNIVRGYHAITVVGYDSLINIFSLLGKITYIYSLSYTYNTYQFYLAITTLTINLQPFSIRLSVILGTAAGVLLRATLILFQRGVYLCGCARSKHTLLQPLLLR